MVFENAKLIIYQWINIIVCDYVHVFELSIRQIAGLMMTMSMLKQASSKSWLSSKLWLLELEIVVRRKGCVKFE